MKSSTPLIPEPRFRRAEDTVLSAHMLSWNKRVSTLFRIALAISVHQYFNSYTVRVSRISKLGTILSNLSM